MYFSSHRLKSLPPFVNSIIRYDTIRYIYVHSIIASLIYLLFFLFKTICAYKHYSINSLEHGKETKNKGKLKRKLSSSKETVWEIISPWKQSVLRQAISCVDQALSQIGHNSNCRLIYTPACIMSHIQQSRAQIRTISGDQTSGGGINFRVSRGRSAWSSDVHGVLLNMTINVSQGRVAAVRRWGG